MLHKRDWPDNICPEASPVNVQIYMALAGVVSQNIATSYKHSLPGVTCHDAHTYTYLQHGY